MAEAKYPIKTTADEFTRLKIQADLFRDDARTMLASLGAGSGLRVLDLCRGTGGITDVLSDWVGEHGRVIGADLDPDKLAYARGQTAGRELSNIEFIETNAFDTGLRAPEGCRCPDVFASVSNLDKEARDMRRTTIAGNWPTAVHAAAAIAGDATSLRAAHAHFAQQPAGGAP